MNDEYYKREYLRYKKRYINLKKKMKQQGGFRPQVGGVVASCTELFKATDALWTLMVNNTVVDVDNVDTHWPKAMSNWINQLLVPSMNALIGGNILKPFTVEKSVVGATPAHNQNNARAKLIAGTNPSVTEENGNQDGAWPKQLLNEINLVVETLNTKLNKDGTVGATFKKLDEVDAPWKNLGDAMGTGEAQLAVDNPVLAINLDGSFTNWGNSEWGEALKLWIFGPFKTEFEKKANILDMGGELIAILNNRNTEYTQLKTDSEEYLTKITDRVKLEDAVKEIMARISKEDISNVVEFNKAYSQIQTKVDKLKGIDLSDAAVKKLDVEISTLSDQSKLLYQVIRTALIKAVRGY